MIREGIFRKSETQTAGNSSRVLIPVDFSPKGFLAVNVGFELARRLSCEVCLIHASVVDMPSGMIPQFPDDFNGMDNEQTEIDQMEVSEEVHDMDVRSMDALKRKIEKMQRAGSLPDIKFDTVITPGMPEEVISEYCELTPPRVVVMATRGREKRREELVGSVTAEVIDHAYATVMTVPEDYTFIGFKEIVRICAFCYFDEGDFECVSRLLEMFGRPEVRIFLFPASEKLKGMACVHELRMLQERLKQQYPNSEFIVGDSLSQPNLRDGVEALFRKENIQMILAPNRKRNALSRFFRPGLPHKILYEIDFPMLAIPV